MASSLFSHIFHIPKRRLLVSDNRYIFWIIFCSHHFYLHIMGLVCYLATCSLCIPILTAYIEENKYSMAIPCIERIWQYIHVHSGPYIKYNQYLLNHAEHKRGKRKQIEATQVNNKLHIIDQFVFQCFGMIEIFTTKNDFIFCHISVPKINHLYYK